VKKNEFDGHVRCKVMQSALQGYFDIEAAADPRGHLLKKILNIDRHYFPLSNDEMLQLAGH